MIVLEDRLVRLLPRFLMCVEGVELFLHTTKKFQKTCRLLYALAVRKHLTFIGTNETFKWMCGSCVKEIFHCSIQRPICEAKC